MAEELVGCYKYQSSENFEEYLEASDFPAPIRMMMAKSEPMVKIENDGDNWTLRYKIQMMTMAMEFTIGQEFEENNPLLGETIKNTATITEDNHLQVRGEHSKGTNITTFSPTEDGMKVVFHHEEADVTATRFFEKINSDE